MTNPFHLAFPVKDINKTKDFYVHILGASVTQSTEKWLNLNFYGNQLSIHQHPLMKPDVKKIVVEETEVPLNHFGVLLKKKDWEKLAEKLLNAGIDFLIPPRTKHETQMCEHKVMFIKDPSGNGIEFKCYTDPKHAFDH